MLNDPLNQYEVTSTSSHLLQFSPQSRKLIFLARSFGRHALELGNEIPQQPLYFLKAPSTILEAGQDLMLPQGVQSVHYEAEVAVVIGKTLSKASEQEAFEAIEAWTILNDVTARSVQKEEGGKFTRAKGYDGFCPMAHRWLKQLDWKSARLQGWLNQNCVQDAPLTDMLFSPGEALASISQVMTLYPGDLVSLGTPAGVGEFKAGDCFEVRLCQDLGTEVTQPSDHPIILNFTHQVSAKVF